MTLERLGWPESWQSVPLWSLFRRVKDVGHPDEEMLSVYRDHGVVQKDSRADNFNKTAENRNIYQLVDVGWLIVNRMKAWQGSLGISPYRGIVSGHYICFRPAHNECPKFLDYLLRSNIYAAELRQLSRGVRPNQIEIDNDWLRVLPVFLPPLGVQRAIADYLDAETARIDALIERKRRMVELLGTRMAEFRRLSLLGGMNPITGEGRVSDAWRVANMGVAFALQRGHDLPMDDRREGVIPVVSSGGISGWHDEAVCQPPGVVTGRYGTIGEVFLVDRPYWPLNTTLFVKEFRGNDPRWVYRLLQALPLDYDAEKSAVTGINRNVIGGLRVPVPPLAEQRQIADRFDEVEVHVEGTKEKLNRQIDLLIEHRQALITAAVTGDLPIPGVAA
jgi:type I restriction enzyme S subunit